MPGKEAGALSVTAPARAEKSGRVSVWLAARRSTRSSLRSTFRLALGSQSSYVFLVTTIWYGPKADVVITPGAVGSVAFT